MAFTNSFLTEVELERSRSADEFFSWVHNIIATAGKEPEGKTSIRLKRGLFKPLMEELLPLALMCKGFFNCDPRVEITPLLGNQNYDATVIDRRPNPVT